MADVGNFTVGPTLRCCAVVKDSPRTWCGLTATHLRPQVSDFPAGYFCPVHSQPGDKRIAESYLFRRVSVQLEVLFAGVSMQPGEAEYEAVELLNQLIRRAGGLVNLHTVTSAVGRYSPPAPLRRGPASRGAR